MESKKFWLLAAALFFIAKPGASRWLPPVSGQLRSGFGWRKDPTDPTKDEFHNGVDIKCSLGTPVKAPLSGKVLSVYRDDDLGGLQVRIKHDNGFSTGYAHLSKALVEKGQRVEKGSVIALSGNTGKSTGPHLHFTVTDPDGRKVDPTKFVKLK